MDGILTSVGQFPIYTQSLFVVLAFLWFGFVVYKKGVEYHYKDESLLDLVILSGILGWIMARLFFVIFNLALFKQNWLRIILLTEYPGYSFVGLLVGVVLAVLLLSYSGVVKKHEALDLIGLGLPSAMAIGEAGLVFGGSATLVWQLPREILMALLFLLGFVWLWRLEGEYRTFEWYRYRKTQAKSGFIFGSFLVLSGLVIGGFGVISGRVGELIIGGLMVILGAAYVYRRSGRSLSTDLSNLIKKIGVVYTNFKWINRRRPK